MLVYDIEHDMQVSLYPFQAQIPILISGGACVMDMAAIDEYIREWEENGILKP